MIQNQHNLVPCECFDHLIFEWGFSKAGGKGGWLAKGLEDKKALAAALDHAMADGAQRARRGKLAAQSMAAFVPEERSSIAGPRC